MLTVAATESFVCVCLQTGRKVDTSREETSFLTSLCSMLLQLVDFEAMTTPSPDSFSKTAKTWMNLKR